MIKPNMSFPSAESVPNGFWRAVFFTPNFDSPERLVVGVLATINGQTILTRANSLEKLRCLYGNEGSVATQVIEYGLDEIDRALRQNQEIESIGKIVSGLNCGEATVAQAYSPRDLGTYQMKIISSLFDEKKPVFGFETATVHQPFDTVDREKTRDRLPVLVMNQVAERVPSAKSMFNAHIRRLEKDESARLLTHKAYVAFMGKYVAANFATLKPSRHKQSVDVSKRLMWDLEQLRENDKSLMSRSTFEMILYHQSKDDPTITTRQYDHIVEVIDTLVEEGKNREIKVAPFVDVPQIARHILTAEHLV